MRLLRENGPPSKPLPEVPEDIRDRFEKNNRISNVIFALSFLVALGVHLAILLRGPTFQLEVPEIHKGPAAMNVHPDVEELGSLFDVTFLPPEIFAADGTLRAEPEDRFLEARHIDVSGTLSSEACHGRDRNSILPLSGQVYLRVNEYGRVVRAEVRETTGDRCRDALIAGIAGSVWYRWLPNTEHPAPVELIQPMKVTAGGA